MNPNSAAFLKLDSMSVRSGAYELTMAEPAASADGTEITGLLVKRPKVRRAIHRLQLGLFDERPQSDVELLGFLDVDGSDGDRAEAVIKDDDVLDAPEIAESSVPIEIWEGVVIEANDKDMQVVIRAKMNRQMPDHTMSIDRAEVQPQDRDLICPGSVFYLTMYRETTGRGVRNVQEIRFRREPNWTQRMVDRAYELADDLVLVD